MSWTQALCDPCWVIRQGARIAHRVKDAPTNDDVDPFSDLGQTIEAHYRGVLPE